MASNRHLGRIIALQTLFEQDFRLAAGDKDFDLEAVLERNIARYQATVDDKEFIERLVRGVDHRAGELDAELQPVAPDWPIDQIARMDRVILRMGLYELTYEKDVPSKVVINEAVELAKAFGSENSSKFINGVLGTVLRLHNGEAVDLTPKVKVRKKPGADDAAPTADTPAAEALAAEKAAPTGETADDTEVAA